MFEITPSPEFSAWYEDLSEPLAEEVTAQLELVAKAAGLLSPGRVSRALLWFDGTGNGSAWPARFLANAKLPSQRSDLNVRAYEQVRELMLWRREITRCLESALFRTRLAELEPRAAGAALAEIERVRELLRSARTQATLEAGTSSGPVFAALTPREEQVLRMRFGIGTAEPQLKDELERTFRKVLELVGLEPGA